MMDITELPRMFPPPPWLASANWASLAEHGIIYDTAKEWAAKSPALRSPPRPESTPLVIMGPRKSGKTALAAVVWRYFTVKRNRIGAWFRSTDLEMVLRTAHSWGELSEMDEWLYMEVCRCPILVVDDICRLGSPQEARLLEDLLVRRSDLGLASVVTLNDSGAEIPEAFNTWLALGTVVDLSGTR